MPTQPPPMTTTDRPSTSRPRRQTASSSDLSSHTQSSSGPGIVSRRASPPLNTRSVTEPSTSPVSRRTQRCARSMAVTSVPNCSSMCCSVYDLAGRSQSLSRARSPWRKELDSGGGADGGQASRPIITMRPSWPPSRNAKAASAPARPAPTMTMQESVFMAVASLRSQRHGQHVVDAERIDDHQPLAQLELPVDLEHRVVVAADDVDGRIAFQVTLHDQQVGAGGNGAVGLRSEER